MKIYLTEDCELSGLDSAELLSLDYENPEGTLGGNVHKLRIKSDATGKSGGYRTICYYRLFQKNVKSDIFIERVYPASKKSSQSKGKKEISDSLKDQLKSDAKYYLSLTEEQIQQQVDDKELTLIGERQ